MFFVSGIPQPQGSKSAYPFKKKNGGLGVRVVEGRRGKARIAFEEWRTAVRLVADKQGQGYGRETPLKLCVRFSLPRPKSVKREHVTSRPDLDKYVRAVCDALTGVLYTDDSQVVEISARKEYAKDSLVYGAYIDISPIEW